MFSAEVEKVSDTNIFARAVGDRQTIVYSMAYAAGSDLAMVLPIPVPPRTHEAAVRFVSLEECPDFFGELRRGFPTRYEEEFATLGAVDDVEAGAVLEVKQVGAYEASFVPSPEDFGRLDERFRLPLELWLDLKHYRDWGFAVFKLGPTAALTDVHPMAFDFPRRDTTRLFFPTMHMHHRRIQSHADFDHTLYCQAEPALHWHLQEWEDSREAAGEYVHCRAAMKLFDLAYPCWRAVIEGRRENHDTWIGNGNRLPVSAPV